ncbi:MAG: class I SAM-dependent methyltransferase [Magnetospirillum sp.]|nr:class I SAM-dependent methyltransferase [Magnetospirillum sp.]
MIRFGKSFGPLFQHKRDMFADNDALLARQRQLAELYLAQPARTGCKTCDAPLGPPDFRSRGIPYASCPRCGHLNGCHEDSEALCAALYTGDAATDYARAYTASDVDAYERRVADIYLPKAAFLREALSEAGLGDAGISCADLGAGSGYFVSALRRTGFTATGYEVSPTQVALAKAMLGEGAVHPIGVNDLESLAGSLPGPVVSMIGVLEHLRHPRRVMAALTANPNVRHLYLSLPLVGPSVIIEALFPSVTPRHLAVEHTHLYSESSIDWLCREFGWRRQSEWWFGSDIMDLFRAGTVRLGQDRDTRGLQTMWLTHLQPAMDALQLALDERKLSTEVHMVLEKI